MDQLFRSLFSFFPIMIQGLALVFGLFAQNDIFLALHGR